MAAQSTSPQGLSVEEAEVRLASHGRNKLKAAPPISSLKLLLDKFRSPLILVLSASAILLFIVAAVGDDNSQNIDAALITLIVLLNGALGFVQNYRSHQGIETLKWLTAPAANFVRGGRMETALAAVLVPGDIVLLEEGDRVPADGRLIQAYDLSMDESTLTGESMPVLKNSGALPERDCPDGAVGHGLCGYRRLAGEGELRGHGDGHGHRGGQDRRGDPDGRSTADPVPARRGRTGEAYNRHHRHPDCADRRAAAPCRGLPLCWRPLLRP